MQEQASGCVMFADVSGSTKLYEMVGDTAAHAAVDLCVKLFANLTRQHGGRVVRTIGDEVMAVFVEASAACHAARDIQLAVHDMAPVDKLRLAVRVGFHFGPVAERDGDVFGDSVNLAARLTEIASKGQIVTSLETVERLAPLQKMDCRRLYAIPVKGREKEIEIFEVMWSDVDDPTQVVARHATTDAGKSLRLVYRSRVVTVGEERKQLVLGRDAGADLVVADRMASRAHCEIEQRAHSFVLADRSANGTYLSIDGDNEIVLRREETVLRGHGFIALGQSRKTATEFVEFFCE